MTQTIDLGVEYLKRLPIRDDVWQLGIERMPQWIVEAGKPPIRPVVVLCRSATTGLISFADLLVPGETPEPVAVQAITNLTRERGMQYRPQHLELRDRNMEQALRPLMLELGIDLRLREELDLIDEILDRIAEDLLGPLGARTVYAAGVDPEQIRGFAEAAKLFYESALWNHLDSHDLVRGLHPSPPKGLEWFTVMGAGGEEYGLAFHVSPEEHADIMADRLPKTFEASRWLFTFEPIYQLPLRDSELWETRNLPVAGPEAYPLVLHMESSKPVRPVRGHGSRARREERKTIPIPGDELNFLEALLRALAGTTEEELDSGKWSKTVTVQGRDRTLTLTLPALLEPPPSFKPGMSFDRRLMEQSMRNMHRLMGDQEFKDLDELNAFMRANMNEPPPPVVTAEDRAYDLFYQAIDARGRWRVKLAREALHLWPDCADAWVLLAEEMPDASRRMELYRTALESAKRTLGPEPFAKHVGHFWSMVETRPYMRALRAEADELWDMGRSDEAVARYRELLRLNEEDSLGVRYVLLPRLVELGRDDEALEFLDTVEGDPTAMVAYARALLNFRRHGAGIAADNSLRAALRVNPFVVKYLLGNAVPEYSPEAYVIGNEDEAIMVAELLTGPWQSTPRALDWLRSMRRGKKKAKASKKRR